MAPGTDSPPDRPDGIMTNAADDRARYDRARMDAKPVAAGRRNPPNWEALSAKVHALGMEISGPHQLGKGTASATLFLRGGAKVCAIQITREDRDEDEQSRLMRAMLNAAAWAMEGGG